MSKCFQAIDKLKLDNESPPPGKRPKALGMVSCVGDEYVGFKQPLPLEDKASCGLSWQGLRTVACSACA
jgi:dynein heavy chain